MFLRTKFLISIVGLGVFGGSGAGVYYGLKNHPITENATQKETEDSNSGSVGEGEDNPDNNAEEGDDNVEPVDDNAAASKLKVGADSHIA